MAGRQGGKVTRELLRRSSSGNSPQIWRLRIPPETELTGTAHAIGMIECLLIAAGPVTAGPVDAGSVDAPQDLVPATCSTSPATPRTSTAPPPRRRTSPSPSPPSTFRHGPATSQRGTGLDAALRRHGLTHAGARVPPNPASGPPAPWGSGQPAHGGTRPCRLPGRRRPTSRARRPTVAGRYCKCGDQR